ncbi:MAG: nuclear transport factor 2 family protein [Pseudomonadota bacterium]
MDLQQVLSIYAEAWNEADSEKRLSLLERCWSDDGQYMDPAGTASGRAQLSGYIGEFHARMPGARIELISGASAHNSRIYFKWQLISGDGVVKIDGVDFGSVSRDGRLQEIVGFFGAPPERTGS